jgi:hypothetical protein
MDLGAASFIARQFDLTVLLTMVEHLGAGACGPHPMHGARIVTSSGA